MGLLKEQPVFLTSEPSFQLLLVIIYEAQHTVGAVVLRQHTVGAAVLRQHTIGAAILSLQCVAEGITNSAAEQAKAPAWGVPPPILLRPD